MLVEGTNRLLAGLADMAAEPAASPSSAVLTISFDETTQTLALPPSSLFSHRRIMVSLSCMVLQYADGSRLVDIIRPPVALQGTAAPFLAHGLLDAGSIQGIMRSCMQLLSVVGLKALHFNRDGASSNSKCLAAVYPRLLEMCPGLLVSDKVFAVLSKKTSENPTQNQMSQT